MTPASRDFILAALAIFATAFLGFIVPPAVFAGAVVGLIMIGAFAFLLMVVWPTVRR